MEIIHPYIVLNLYDLISSAKYKGDGLNMCISCSFSYSESGWQPEDVELQKSTINVSIWQCTKVFLRHIEKSYLITMITIHLHCMEKWSLDNLLLINYFLCSMKKGKSDICDAMWTVPLIGTNTQYLEKFSKPLSTLWPTASAYALQERSW